MKLSSYDEVVKRSKLPPPPTKEERLREALAVLNRLDVEYEIRAFGMLFIKKEDGSKE